MVATSPIRSLLEYSGSDAGLEPTHLDDVIFSTQEITELHQ